LIFFFARNDTMLHVTDLYCFFQIYLFLNTQFLFKFIYSIRNHKINTNINKNKGTQVTDIKSHFINIMINLQWR